MGSPLGNYKGIEILDGDTCLISGFIAIDGAANVIGYAPSVGANPSGPYTMCKGLMNAIGPAGSVKTQPHGTVGVYTFTLDEPWWALLMPFQPTILDGGVVSTLDATIQSNVRNTNTTQAPYSNGLQPGNSTSVTNKQIILTFRSSTGTATDPPVNGGFYVGFLLKRAAKP